jgi:sarcosine oxidase
MTSQPYDAIVVGLGAAGAATVYQLARKGSRVLGIDRFDPPHTMGSTHGDTRITRLAIGEGAQYTPLAIRSHEIWRDIERETGADLLTQCGALYIAPEADDSVLHGRPGFLTRTQEAAERYDIPIERLDATQVRRRFPRFNMQSHERALFEPTAGFVRPEACVRAQLSLAAQLGANILRHEQFLRYDIDGAGLVTVETSRGRYTTRRLVLSMGPWIATAVPSSLASLFTIVRQVLVWFDVSDDIAAFEPARCPVHIWALADDHDIYGFPAVDGPHGGVKIATEQYAETTTADTVRREVSEAETAELFERFVAPCFPSVSPRVLRTATCLYTVTRDFDFIIDSLPDQPQVIVVSPCSGHGFKHSAAIGESVASVIRDEVPRVALDAFRAPWHRVTPDA